MAALAKKVLYHTHLDPTMRLSHNLPHLQLMHHHPLYDLLGYCLLWSFCTPSLKSLWYFSYKLHCYYMPLSIVIHYQMHHTVQPIITISSSCANHTTVSSLNICKFTWCFPSQDIIEDDMVVNYNMFQKWIKLHTFTPSLLVQISLISSGGSLVLLIDWPLRDNIRIIILL